MKIGIDQIGFYTPQYFVDMNDLAESRGVDPAKFTIGIGQSEMAVAPLTQDSVTLAANAALTFLDDEMRESIDLVLFGTETGIDQSKSAGIYVHDLLDIQRYARTVEMKQACYSATAALQLAKGHIALNPKSKVLVLASDIARYGLSTAGEVTQGAGAVAMLISANPRILSLENDSAYITKDIMDFWRPNYSPYAYVDGKYSNDQYIAFFNEVWEQYKGKTNRSLDDFAALCFHLPYTKMGLKALRTILDETSEANQNSLQQLYEHSTTYGRKIGNIYTASLYLGLVSLLENSETLQAGDRVGLFSYGSGAVGEFFTGILEEGYEEALQKDTHRNIFAQREKVSVAQYEEMFTERLPEDGSEITLSNENDPALAYVSGMKDHMRLYTRK